MLSNSYYKNTDGYYIAFRDSEKNGKDVTKFLEFCFKMAIEALDSIKQKVIFFIRDFALKDFYNHLRTEKKIKVRQYDLIRVLLENNMSFNLEKLFEDVHLLILYRKVSKATARRDIKELLQKGIIISTDKKEYVLNKNILDYIDN
jgi:Fic family protein